MSRPTSDRIQARARDLLADADRIFVLTGAGVSAESGVPTFRSADGLWRALRPEELATPSAFARDPRLVWEWYDWRRERVRSCRPNAAHVSLAQLAVDRGAGVRIATQNVDGLHAVAAAELIASRPTPVARAQAALPLELHGSLFRVRCTGCGRRRSHAEPVDVSSADALPRCDHCGALLRPDVVWFGEPLDDAVLGDALQSARAAAVCLVIGTSAVVQPAASLAMVTKRAGGSVVEVNPEETPLTPFADVSIRARAAHAVPPLLA
jgi:NAD-dependent deacetylase